MALEKAVDSFEPVTVEELDKIKLLNRQDTKYIFSIGRLPMLLSMLKDNYLMLDVEGKRLFQYESLYFDTDDLKFYLEHHNGKLNRYKIRYRKYVDTGSCFFEIKYKNNKRRTIKYRIKRKQIKLELGKRAKQLVREHLQTDPESISGKLWIYFQRFTLASKDFEERLTIELNLNFKTDTTQKELRQLVIAEIKQERFTTRSEFVQVMRSEKISPLRLSKYCTGTVLTNKTVKYNRFKPKILTINRLHYGTASNMG